MANAQINDFTQEEWEDLLYLFDNRCAYCWEKFAWYDLTQDHDIPLSKGGDHTLINIYPACLPCNRGKGIKTRSEFMRSV